MGRNPGTREPIEFGTDGWRAPLSLFTTDRVKMVAQAVASYLDSQDCTGPVAIGYDAREHSPKFADELGEVLAANGREVVISDRDCPTPALAWSVEQGEYAGGLVITASHNPPAYNGVKFVPGTGSPALPTVTDELERRLATPKTNERNSKIRETDFLTPYIEHVSDFLRSQLGITPSLDGLTIAYDAMHGSGRGVTNEVLSRAGARVTSRRCSQEPDFGGTAPEPTAENATALIEAVRNGKADIGFVNDGDSDRVGIVTPERGFVDPNLVLALLYDFLLEHTDGDVVRTVSTSSLVDRIADAHDQAVHQTAVGFKWVAEAMDRHDALAGGEESGGYGISAHLQNKDGVLVALVAAAAHVEQPLDTRIDELFEKYGEIHQGRRSLDCPNEQKATVLASLTESNPETIAEVPVEDITTVDGMKIELEDGTWILVRPSGTEPKLRIYAEAKSESRLDTLLDAGESFVGSNAENHLS
ncbi:phosphoglucomutase/phosphomannomutase family protein [Halovenus rubra]|uniref:Phosphoglucomutase/phosphomannomutase family protein n=2 Tax=Halovenus rubra TaxID=869890 RepID=A0ACC7E1M1_9EURY|nr:phosphoglucomutase/phosphomannomutase family protein [Halovenus rubra]